MELLFDTVRNELPEFGINAQKIVVPFPSKGLAPRIQACRWVRRHQETLNHITGDVHYLALGLPKSNTILTIHDVFALHRLNGLKRAIYRTFWVTLPIRHCAVTTVISTAIRDEIAKLVPVAATKIQIIPDTIPSWYHPVPRTSFSYKPTVLAIGTKQNKNLERLVAAIQGLPCRLHVVGALSHAQLVLIRQSGIEFQHAEGLSNEAIFQAYVDADIVSFVSTYEGFGMPIIEAQMVERPVITSNCSSMPEVAGDAALLVDPLDVPSIRHGLQRLISEPALREALIAKGRINRDRFSARTVAQQYAALYRQVFDSAQKSR